MRGLGKISRSENFFSNRVIARVLRSSDPRGGHCRARAEPESVPTASDRREDAVGTARICGLTFVLLSYKG